MKNLIANRFLIFVISVLLWSYHTETAKAQVKGFDILKYNNPDLIVDLGVGLWAWPLPYDYDKDGDMDLVVSSQGKPFNGLFLFENTTGSKNPVFAKPVLLNPSIKDIQLSYVNSKPRFTIPGFELLNFSKSYDQDKKSLFPIDSILKDIKGRKRFNQWRLVDYENDGDIDIVVGVDDWYDYGWDNAFNKKGEWIKGKIHGYVYFIENVNGKYINKGKLKAGDKILDVFGAPSPNFADFDNDGDLDIICGEFLDKLIYFENAGNRKKPFYKEGRYLTNNKGIIKMDLQMIIPIAVDWDKDGFTDLVIGDEDGRVALVKNLGKTVNNMPLFTDPVYFKQQADNVKFGALATPFGVDWDNDGDEDIICGNSAGYVSFIENIGLLNGMPKWEAPKLIKSEDKIIRIQAGYNGSIQGPAEAKWGYTTLSVEDWDHDGLKDLIVNSIWGKVIWFKNIGDKKSPKFGKEMPILVEWKDKLTPSVDWNWWTPEPGTLATQWRTTPFVTDWNKDGLNDLIMLDKDGFLAFFERYKSNNKIYLKQPQRIFYAEDYSAYNGNNEIKEASPGLLALNNQKFGASGRRKFTITDWDLDGKPDILLNSLNATFFKNMGIENNLVRFKNLNPVAETVLAGHDTSPTVVDWDKDGIPDILLGAEDGHFYYYSNPNKKSP